MRKLLRRLFGTPKPIQLPPHSAEEFAWISYTIAYRALPRHLSHPAIEKVEKWFAGPDAIRDSLYRVGCIMSHCTMRSGESQRIMTHMGRLDDHRDYFIFEYPTPPAPDASQGRMLLAPYFSAMIHHAGTADCECYALGQSPDGGTTIRAVKEGEHVRLDIGLDPTLENWIVWLRRRYIADPVAH